MRSKSHIILIAEDDDGHAELTIGCIRDAGIKNEIIRFKDGVFAWEFLGNLHADSDFVPELLLLDINMPRMDGVELLRLMKSDVKFAVLPVIVLTTTDDPREIRECYALGCNYYLIKPVEPDCLNDVLSKLGLNLEFEKV